MFDLISLAFKNTLRNTRRSIITITTIAVGCTSLLCFAGFNEYVYYSLREGTIRNELGHMQIFKKGYHKNRRSAPDSVLIENSEEVINALSGIEGITTVTGRLNFEGLGGTEKSSQFVQVFGIDIEKELAFGKGERLRKGRKLAPGDRDQGVVGRGLMVELDTDVGEWITIFTTTHDGIFNAVEFQIAGVISTGFKAKDAVSVKIPLELAQLALDTKSVEHIIVLLDETKDLPKIRKVILSKLDELDGEFETRTWYQLAEFYRSIVNIYDGMFSVFTTIIVIVVLFSVLNTMTMAVLERTPEISALRAIGARRLDVLKLILLEGTIIGILGGLLGTIVSFAISGLVYLNDGFVMPPPPGSSTGYMVYLQITASDCALVFFICLVTAFLSSFFPALRAQRVKISEGLRA